MRRIVVTAAVVGLVAMTLGSGVAHAAGPQPEPPTSCAITGRATFKSALQPSPAPVGFKDHGNIMRVYATLTDCTQQPQPTPFVPIDHGLLTLKATARTSVAPDFFATSCAGFKITWFSAAGKRIGTTQSGPMPGSTPCPRAVQPMPGPGMQPGPNPFLTLQGSGTATAKSKVFAGEPFTITMVTSEPTPMPMTPFSSFDIGTFGGGGSTIDIGA